MILSGTTDGATPLFIDCYSAPAGSSRRPTDLFISMNEKWALNYWWSVGGGWGRSTSYPLRSSAAFNISAAGTRPAGGQRDLNLVFISLVDARRCSCSLLLPCLPLLRSSIHPQSIQFQNIVIRTSRWSQPTGIAFQQQGRPSTPLSSSLFFQGIHHNVPFPGYFLLIFDCVVCVVVVATSRFHWIPPTRPSYTVAYGCALCASSNRFRDNDRPHLQRFTAADKLFLKNTKKGRFCFFLTCWLIAISTIAKSEY